MKFGTLYAYWTREWTGDYKYFAKKVSDIGFDILEISAGDLLAMTDAEVDELKAISKGLGIEITSNIGPAKKYDVASSDKHVREAGIKFLSDIMKKMDRLDSRAIVGVMYTYWPNDFTDLDKDAAWSRGVESVKRLGKIASALGIDYCLEVVNRYETHILNTAEEGVRYCKDVDCDSVKLLLDTFHMNIEEDNLAKAIRTAGSYLGHVHVGEGNRKLPGEGHLPWKEIGAALNEIGFAKGVVMEPFVTMGGKVGEDIKVWRDLSGGTTAEKMDEDIKKSLQFLKSTFGGNI
ncbi:MAG: sugar phosphate isomerase/epimerase [Ruminococcaceae bacterium]|nr:sugar phosphate isomerase/epimerase [Oscillospiraceae bacterium]